MTAQLAPGVLSADPWWTWKSASLRQPKKSSGFSSQEPHYYFYWARNAIYHCLELLNIKPGSRVLIPAYICRAAVDPFLAYGLDIDFYAIKRDCNADLLDLEKRITPETKAILAVHFFGFPQGIRGIRKICDEHQISLIEDCAHVLSGEIDGRPLGSFGDAAIFSWRKFLPVYDGGELVINRPRHVSTVNIARETPLFTLRAALNVIERTMRYTRGPLFRAAYGGFRTMQNTGRRCADAVVRRPAALRVESSSIAFDKDISDLPASRVSRWIKSHSDIGSIISKRRRNYEILLNELASPKISPLFPSLPDSVCPWVFPVLFNGVSQGHRRLRQHGIPAAAWDDVRHPALPAGSFSDSDFLYENLVFLPIHQCLDDRDMMNVASIAKSL